MGSRWLGGSDRDYTAGMSDGPDFPELEARVQQARDDLDALYPKLRGSHGGEPVLEWFRTAVARLNAAQAALAAARGEEWAEPLAWKPAWNTGAPSPHVVASSRRTYLIYLVNEPEPNWDGTYVRVVRSSSDEPMPLATVCFERCYWHKFGGANDEVFHGHPLDSRGFGGPGAYLVHNSRWLEEARAINSVHSQYDPDTWTALRHYLLAFHDNTFECLARGYKIELTRESFGSALARCVAQVVK